MVWALVVLVALSVAVAPMKGATLSLPMVAFIASVTGHVMSMSVRTIAMVESATTTGAMAAMICTCLQQVLLV